MHQALVFAILYVQLSRYTSFLEAVAANAFSTFVT